MAGPLGISTLVVCSVAWVAWIPWVGAYTACQLGSVRSSSPVGLSTAGLAWITAIGVCLAVGVRGSEWLLIGWAWMLWLGVLIGIWGAWCPVAVKIGVAKEIAISV